MNLTISVVLTFVISVISICFMFGQLGAQKAVLDFIEALRRFPLCEG